MLQSQGWGTRKECRRLISQGLVAWAGRVILDPEEKIPFPEQEFPEPTYQVGTEQWVYRPRVVIALYKPAGYECSAAPQHHRSVHELLVENLRRRGIQPVGRLDQDTTGLLILTDDGALSHQLAGPKHHVIKTYQVLGAEDFTEEHLQILRTGVVLRGETLPDRVLSIGRPAPNQTPWPEAPENRIVELTIDQGKYHQVRRMIAAAGNKCMALHRPGFGSLNLRALDLKPGEWVYLSEKDLAELLIQKV